jgi:hypothetical protein
MKTFRLKAWSSDVESLGAGVRFSRDLSDTQTTIVFLTGSFVVGPPGAEGPVLAVPPGVLMQWDANEPVEWRAETEVRSIHVEEWPADWPL